MPLLFGIARKISDAHCRFKVDVTTGPWPILCFKALYLVSLNNLPVRVRVALRALHLILERRHCISCR